jgi:hypothetical protein
MAGAGDDCEVGWDKDGWDEAGCDDEPPCPDPG